MTADNLCRLPALILATTLNQDYNGIILSYYMSSPSIACGSGGLVTCQAVVAEAVFERLCMWLYSLMYESMFKDAVVCRGNDGAV